MYARNAVDRHHAHGLGPTTTSQYMTPLKIPLLSVLLVQTSNIPSCAFICTVETALALTQKQTSMFFFLFPHFGVQPVRTSKN